MHDKLAQLRRLLADGYTIEDIDSDEGVVEATLTRRGRRATVRLYPSDAERLLRAGPGPLWRP